MTAVPTEQAGTLISACHHPRALHHPPELGVHEDGDNTIAGILSSLAPEDALSIAEVLPMPAHLALDALGGIFLAASPWAVRIL